MCSYGVMVSTLDFESSDPSSNLGRSLHFFLTSIINNLLNISGLHQDWSEHDACAFFLCIWGCFELLLRVGYLFARFCSSIIAPVFDDLRLDFLLLRLDLGFGQLDSCKIGSSLVEHSGHLVSGFGWNVIRLHLVASCKLLVQILLHSLHVIQVNLVAE